MSMMALVAALLLLLTPPAALASQSGISTVIERSPCQGECKVREGDVGTSLLQKNNILGKQPTIETAKLKPIPPIGLVKKHKCASSTLKRIVESLGITRNMSRMMPVNKRLGFPVAFPGLDNSAKYTPKHQFQLIVDHAIFNEEKYRSYLAPDPVFITPLREPVSQAVSAFNFFKVAKKPSLKLNASQSWESHLEWLKNLPFKVEHDKDMEYFLNPQAALMGWYEWVGMTSVYDHNKTVIDRWLDTLDSSFGEIGSQFFQDRFDESLVLLQRRLKVDIKEMAYLYKRKGTENVEPTSRQRDQLKEFLTVDIALYDHFNKKFTEFWHRDEEENLKLLNELQQAKAKYEAFCGSESEKAHPTGFCRIWHSDRWLKRADGAWPWHEATIELFGCVPPSCTKIM
jgi:hypothetical protein